MHRIDTSGAIATFEPSGIDGTQGHFSDGDPQTGQRATQLNADFMEALQEELIAIVAAAGASPTKANKHQVRDAINTLIANAVTTAIDNLKNSAPATLDTLKELADALGDDENFSATVLALIAKKANVYAYAGNPNGHVAGNAGVAGTSPPDLCEDTTNGNLWVCKTSGNAAAAKWVSAGAPKRPYPVKFEDSGTYTFDDDITAETLFEAEGVGSGGGGGAAEGGGSGSGGNGAPSGDYGLIIFKGATAGADATVTVGNPGTGGTNAAGTAGGDVVLTIGGTPILTLHGGPGGTTASDEEVLPIGPTLNAGSLTIVESYLFGAGAGEPGSYINDSKAIGGRGGSNPLGQGGGQVYAYNGGTTTGLAGKRYGGGGGGGASTAGSAKAGGNGAKGMLRIRRLTL